MESPCILVVEDDKLNMWCMLEYLKQMNFNVISATNAEEAFEVMRTNDADCMLLDINLGDEISGLELMEMFREQKRFKNIPIIAVTAYFGGDTHLELIKKGFTDYLAKPYQQQELQQILQKHGIHSAGL